MYISLSDRGADPADSDSPDGPSPKTRKGLVRVSSTVITLGIVSMLTDVSSESIAAVLPIYITGALGFSTIAYGFIDGLYQGVSALVRIGGGWAADRADRPKWVAFAGYGLSAVSKIWLLLAAGFGALVAVVAVDRIGKGIRTAPRDALITASSDRANLGRSFGVHRMLDTIGAAVGPLLAFLILYFVPSGFTTVFVASLACAAVGVLVLGLLVPNRRPRHEAADAAGAPARSAFRLVAFRDPRLRLLLAASGLLGLLAIGDGFIYLSLQARSEFAATWFPLLYVGTNVAFFLFAIPFGRIADRIGRWRMFVIGHVGLLLAYVCTVVPVGGPVLTVVALVLLGAFYAATDGVLAAVAAQLSPPDNVASGIAAAQTVVAVARLVSASVFGVLWFGMGREPAMLLVAVLLVVAIPAAYLLLRRGLRGTTT